MTSDQKAESTKAVQTHRFGDRDDKGSVEADLRAKAEAREIRQYNERMKKLEAEDATKRGGLLTKVARFFSSTHGTR